jgi:two-component system, sensor histidine kinase
MRSAPVLENETERLQELLSYDILDTLPEKQYDSITEIASRVCKTPIALISLIDESRFWFKSKRGIDLAEGPREISFCGHAISSEKVFVVPNALEDDRFMDNRLVTGPANIRFYAGAPLCTPSGMRIGTLCVIDHIPNNLSADQIVVMQSLARDVMNLFELRKTRSQLKETQLALDLAQAKVAELVRSKEEFIINVGHEIRSPMNGIIGMSEILLAAETNPERRESLKIIQSAGKTLMSLVNNVADVSKIESGSLDIESSLFDSHYILGEPIKTLQIMASKKELYLTLSVDPTVPRWVEGDANRLKQIMKNLIVNGLKFTEKGGVHVEVTSAPLVGNEAELFVRVKDTGKGLSKEKQLELFKDFSNLPTTSYRHVDGGMGLTISKKLCESMGGKISFFSEINSGSVVEFSIKVKIAKTPTVPAIKIDERIIPLGHKHPLEILLVEDNSVNRKVLLAYLRMLGYEPDFAENGSKALQLAEKNIYDLILMDCQLPEMDGLEASRKLIQAWRSRGIDDNFRAKIIAITANAFLANKVRCAEAGMDGFLAKPLMIDDLKKLLESCGPRGTQKLDI